MQRFQSSSVDESSPLDPLNDSLIEQITLTTDLCEGEQPELVDSKENLKALCEDQKFNMNYICDHTMQINHLDSKITQCMVQNTETHLKLDGFRKTLELVLHKIGIEGDLPLDGFQANDTGGEYDFEATSGISSKFDVIDGKITKCILSNKLTHSKMDNLQKLLDMILKNIENALVDPETSTEPLLVNDDAVVFRFPISSVNELNILDEELQQNEILMSNLVAKFSKIAGDSGNKSAKKVGVKIIERIISAKLLTKFTWTGRTNGPNNLKLPFITYSSIFNLCLQVISKADRSFDTNACENFLKNNILKHSSMRLSRKFNKKIKRPKPNDETWYTSSKLVINGTSKQSQFKRSSVQPNVPEQKTETEEDAFAEEVIDSKANIVNLLNVQMETRDNPEIDEKSNHCFSTNSFLKKCDHDSKLSIMDTKISHCIESNTLVHSKIDNMQETLNDILNKIGKCQGFVRNPTVSYPTPATVSEIVDYELESFYFPITSVSELQDLNKKLSKSENFENKMINKFISIAGNAKKMSTQRFGLEVVESVISPQLLLKYSWTGRSKSIKPKFAFMKYQYIVNFFQKVISKVDICFTRKECEDFLRFTVFKYINMRVARNRQKVKDPISEYYSDREVSQEFNSTSLSIDEVPMETPEEEQSYEYEHKSALEFSEANTKS